MSNWCLLLCHWDWCNSLIKSAVLMINDLMLIRHYIRLSMTDRRDWYQMWTLFVCLFLNCRPTWGYGPLIACRPRLFMLTLSVISFVPCMWASRSSDRKQGDRTILPATHIRTITADMTRCFFGNLFANVVS